MKYLKRTACRNIFARAAAADAINGTKPTLNRSCGVTLVVRKRIMNGTMLAGMATSRQFKNVLDEL
jgi:alcohol dehydrogenase class IV